MSGTFQKRTKKEVIPLTTKMQKAPIKNKISYDAIKRNSTLEHFLVFEEEEEEINYE